MVYRAAIIGSYYLVAITISVEVGFSRNGRWNDAAAEVANFL